MANLERLPSNQEAKDECAQQSIHKELKKIFIVKNGSDASPSNKMYHLTNGQRFS
jgi:hypothetical protein